METKNYLERIEREISAYGKVSDAIAVKLIDSLSIIENCQNLGAVLRRFFDLLSRGKSWDFAFFIPYAIDASLHERCIAYVVGDDCERILTRAFNEIPRIPDPNAQNYAYMLTIKSLYSYGSTKVGDELSRLLASNMDDLSSIERCMYVARALAAKDFDESDNMFMRIRVRISRVHGDLNKAVLLAKLAYHVSKTFNDKEGKRIARECLNDSLEIKNSPLVDHVRYLSLALPYILSVDLTLGSKLMDSLLHAIIHRKDWVEHCRCFLDSCNLIVDGIDKILRVESWIHRAYEEKRISEIDYYRLIAAARGTIIYLDPFYASSIITSSNSPVVGVSAQNVEASIDILKNLAKMDISTTYELSSILMRELMVGGKYPEAIELCARLQGYFPNKIQEQCSFIIMPFLKRLGNQSQIVQLLPNLSMINADCVKDLIKSLLKSAEKISNPLMRAREIASIASAICRGYPAWSKQLLLYAEELVEGYDLENKVEIIETIIETLTRIDEKAGLKRLQRLISPIAEIDPKAATRIIEKLMHHLKKCETKTITKQLLQYVMENKKK